MEEKIKKIQKLWQDAESAKNTYMEFAREVGVRYADSDGLDEWILRKRMDYLTQAEKAGKRADALREVLDILAEDA